MNKKAFRITGGKGFHIHFANGWGVSVQFGPGNYCDNYDMNIGSEDADAGSRGSNTAECAVFNPKMEMVNVPFQDRDYEDTVTNRSDAAMVLNLLNWAAEQPASI